MHACLRVMEYCIYIHPISKKAFYHIYFLKFTLMNVPPYIMEFNRPLNLLGAYYLIFITKTMLF